MTSTLNSVATFLHSIPKDKRKFCAMGMILQIALDVADQDPIGAVGILECAKLDLHNQIHKPPDDHDFEELAN